MKLLAVGGALLVAGAAVLACSGDDETNSGTAPGVDGGTSNEGGSTTPDGTFTCNTKATQIGALPNRSANGMAANDTTIFAWDNGGGLDTGSGSKTGAIVKLAKSGGDVTTLYAPTSTKVDLVGLLVSGDDVFTTEITNDDAETHKLVRISASSGTATTVAERPGTQEDFGELVAVDDASVFYFHGDSLFRQPRAGGAPFEIAKTGFLSAQVFGPDLILGGGGLGQSPLWRVARNATTDSAVKLTDNTGCFGQLTPVEGGYYCAETTTLKKLGADFAPAETIWRDTDGTDGDTARLPRIIGIVGNKAYFSVAGATTVRAFDVGATSTTLLGCGADGVLEGVVDATAVYVRVMPAEDGQPWPIMKLAR